MSEENRRKELYKKINRIFVKKLRKIWKVAAWEKVTGLKKVLQTK